MKKSILYMLALCFLVGCGKSYEEQKRITKVERDRLHQEDLRALHVAVLPTLDCMPLLVAKECEMYDTARLDFRPRFFHAQMDCDTAFTGRSVEGMVSDLVRTERIRREGTEVSYLTSTNAYWQLLSNPKARLKRIDQLGDKMVAMTRYSVTDRLTDLALKNQKLSSIVFRVQVNDVFVRLDMLRNNEMDAMWLTEPLATVARTMSAPVLFDTRKDDLRMGVIVFRGDVMKDKRRQGQVKELEKAYNAACDSLNRFGLAHYQDIMEKYYKMDAKTVKKIPSMRFNRITKPRSSDIEAANKKD